ncbi:MAG: hypothetical protein K0S23_1345 [Fluviicola sp.]|jgi:nucleoside-triphosphatase THEP1|uniref:KAP family P-loop NTPase fold protein n=1 Tax=Fluviicola sp. TaxID=1917219 RepID=UPI00260CD840|nr:P-loop NTPase fold protein [Fluviicola sp.]MDF3027038.1 hypothetical protein [Fluviicola sp.]
MKKVVESSDFGLLKVAKDYSSLISGVHYISVITDDIPELFHRAIIVGEWGTGKTTLVEQLKQKFDNSILIDLFAINEHTPLKEVVERIGFQSHNIESAETTVFIENIDRVDRNIEEVAELTEYYPNLSIFVTCTRDWLKSQKGSNKLSSSFQFIDLDKTQLIDSENYDESEELINFQLYILESKRSLWWINASIQFYEEEQLKVGSTYDYPIRDKNSQFKNNFKKLEVGDLLIGFDVKGTKRTYGLLIVVNKSAEFATLKVIFLFREGIERAKLLSDSYFNESSLIKSKWSSPLNTLNANQFTRLLKLNGLSLGEFDFLLSDDSLMSYTTKRSGEFDRLPEEPEIELSNDKIPFHLDVVETIDRLNREPVAKSLARLINEDIFDKNPRNSFMVHLQGSWGSGKSTFLNLLEKNLKTDKRNWIVVKYNAWQNQHITPPWWSFIDQIYQQSIRKENANWCSRRSMKWSENKRRILRYTKWQKVIQFGVFLLSVFLLVIYGKSFVEAAANYPSSVKNDPETKGLALDVFAKLIVSIGATVGVIYTMSKFVSTPFFMRNASDAESFVKRSADPMQSIKSHFEGLINNINREKNEVAVFIDDLDRCNKKYTIELLEGIQTLFKEKRVLYVVAGDKDWIATCFEKNYVEFDKVVSGNQKLGELFLEKAFQLSIRLPQMSESSKKKYWNYILGSNDEEPTAISKRTREDIKQELRSLNQTGRNTDMSQLNELETRYGATEAEVSDVMLEILDENQEDIKHLLTEHHALIEPNPRSIIRLANEYTMYRNILWAERIQFNSDILFRWIILESSYPIIASEIKSNLSSPDPTKMEKLFAEIEDKEKFDKLYFDKESKHGGEMKAEQLANILGINLEKK